LRARLGAEPDRRGENPALLPAPQESVTDRGRVRRKAGAEGLHRGRAEVIGRRSPRPRRRAAGPEAPPRARPPPRRPGQAARGPRQARRREPLESRERTQAMIKVECPAPDDPEWVKWQNACRLERDALIARARKGEISNKDIKDELYKKRSKDLLTYVS